MGSFLNSGPNYLLGILLLTPHLTSYIWFGSNAVLLIFTYFFIPETRDRTLEEIHEMFQAKLPARKFKTYVCTGTETMAKAAIAKEMELGNVDHIERTSTV
jgi:hypothetical protein